jgi:hypothetical protein
MTRWQTMAVVATSYLPSSLRPAPALGSSTLRRPGLNRVEARVLRWPFAGTEPEWMSSQVPRSAQARPSVYFRLMLRVAFNLVSSQLPGYPKGSFRFFFRPSVVVSFRLGLVMRSVEGRAPPLCFFGARFGRFSSWMSARFPRSARDRRTGPQKPELFTRTAR